MQKSKLRSTSIIAYAAVCVLFILFFVYMGIFENVSVQSTRSSDTYRVVEPSFVEEIEDASAPIGIRKQYSWLLSDIDTNDTSLAFYLVHHYAEVYFDDESVYSLMPRETNRIGKSISSNWVTIPLSTDDNGKEVRVVVTPVYESVRDRSIEFRVAPVHSLYMTQLKRDLTQLILSAICFVMGVFVMLVEFILICRKKTQRWDIFFLGNTVVMLGVWKMTDTRFFPLMFDGNPMLLGYIAIGMLFLAGIPFALYLYDRFVKLRPKQMLIVSLIASGIALLVLLCQIFGIADFRQTLPLAHAAIILVVLSMFSALFRQKARGVFAPSKFSWIFVMLLIGGTLTDFLTFYISGNSSNLVFTIFAILIYTMALFIINILDINKRAHTDTDTGLFNKSYWDMLMDTSAPISAPVGMMMMDLNGLKNINDTMGHEAGDKMIYNFAKILNNTIPAANTICRWGGDEFTVMLTDANRETTEMYIEKIRSAVDTYNASGEKPALNYAVGYALSTDFPGMSRKELLEKADANMYVDKQQWYERKRLQAAESNHISKPV